MTPLVDAIGVTHRAIDPAQPLRIVSLVPSITELLCALGLQAWLVGRTGFCIHPAAQVRQIAKVGGTKDINIEKVIALAPTHLIVNVDENPKAAVASLARHIPHVIVTHPLAPCDNLGLYRLLGGIFGRTEQAEALCTEFQAALLDCHAGPEARVLYCIWQDPWMTISRDTYIARMLAQIGWQQWPSPAPARYPVFEWSQDLRAEIDLILLSSEPYRFTQTHVLALTRQTGLPVRLLDGEMLSWYGSRAVAGLRYLQQLRCGAGDVAGAAGAAMNHF